MKMRHQIRFGVAALAIAVCPSAFAQTAGAEDADNGEIIVTAQKRQERLIDVPISISVLGGDTLDRATDRGITEALNRAPNVVNLSYGGAERFGGQTSIVVRGLSVVGGTSGPTAYYLDTVPFGRIRSSATPDASAYDLERVEVLRGPQGTLYGASALSGVVRVLTKEPDLNDFELKTRVSGETTKRGSEGYRGDLAFNVPLSTDKLAVRGVLGYQHRGGWVDKPNDKDANDRKIANARLKLKAKPSDELTILLSGWISRTDFGAPSYSSGPNPLADRARYTSNSLLDESGFNDLDIYNATITYDFPGFTLRSATSYLKEDTSSVLDIAAYAGPGITLDTTSRSKVFSEEINLSSTGDGPWRWALGGIYRYAKDTGSQARNTAVSPFSQNTTSKSYALFGELTRALFDEKLELTAGLRYFEDRLQDVELSNGGAATPLTTTPRNKFDDLAPRFVLTYHPAEKLTVYASYGQGFRSGLNQLFTVTRAAPQFPAAKPDQLANYEVGAKGSAWDGRLNFDAAIFYTKWKDIQQAIPVDVLPPNNIIESALVNAGSASGMGAELNVTIEPVDRLTFGANIGWNDLTFDGDVLDATGGLIVGKGERLPGTPKTTANVFADLAIPLSGSGTTGRLNVSANYVSKFANYRSLTGAYDRKGVVTARASAGVETDKWTASLFVDNLSNAKGYTPDLIRFWDTYLRPRTIGLQFEYKY